jgi:hypothetical protein
MKRKILFIIATIVVVGIVVYIILFSRDGGFSIPVPALETVGSDEATVTKTASVDDLEDGCFYVWHNDQSNDITEDLNHTSSMDVFKLCPSGERNWSKDTTDVNHVLWFDSETDADIPTFYEGDELLYVSSTEIPFEGIQWERYADYGYSIGVANFVSDESGHYHINNPEGKGYTGYIYEKSDAAELNQYTAVSNLFLDKVGNTDVRDNLISDGGTVENLEKNASYVCEWYTGSYYQDYKMKANVHPLCLMETYTTYDYEFLHSSCISIEIPKWFKTGYYYANETGLFRYVKGGDATAYNGEAYDAAIEWNDPIVIKDDNGNVLYDPSTGYTNPVVDGENIYSDDSEDGDQKGDAGTEELQDNEYTIP